MAAHDRSRKVLDDEEEDPVENMIKKTGCLELHYKVQVQIFIVRYSKETGSVFNDRKLCVMEYHSLEAWQCQ